MRLILLLSILFFGGQAHGQIGKFLKEKAKNLATEENLSKLKGATADRLMDARAEMDSTNFNFAISVNDNADVFDTDTGKDKALKLFSNFQTTTESTEEEKARSLLDAGELAYSKGFYNKAEAFLLGAKTKFEASNTQNINYYTTIANLGLLYSTTGRYTKSEEFTLDALNTRAENLGKESLGYGASLNNLAVLQKETGRYNEAEQNAKEALEVLSKATGEESMPVAIALNNLAILNQTMGRYESAMVLMEKSITISAQLQNEKSTNHQKFLANKALLHQEMGEYAEAESIYKELIRIKERRLGSGHPDYAHTLSNLASLYVMMGQTDKVEKLLIDAKAIYEKKFGQEHRLVAASMSDLGNFYRYMGRFDEAKDMLKKSVEINKTALGENHPEYIQNQEDLAIVYWKLGENELATSLFETALSQSLNFINQFFPPMSESEKTSYWDKLRPRFERFYAYALDVKSENLVGQVYDYHIATKGLLLNTTNKVKQKILASGDNDLINKYLLWLDQKQTLANYYAYSKEELKEQNINRDSLEMAANQTERQLSQQSALFTEGYQLKQVSFTDILPKLKADEAAIEIVRYRFFDKAFTEDVRYAALIITAQSKSPNLVVLENGSQLESRYFKYYNNTIHQQLPDEYSFDQYWQPLEANLLGKKRLFVSLDGIYNQINLNSLVKDNRYLLDRFDIHIVGNTKTIGQSTLGTKSKSAFLIGNPTFGGTTIAALPGTKTELATVSKSMTTYGNKIKQYTALEASELNIKTVDNPSVLHIATHGYFMQDIDNKADKVFGVSAESARSNPLLRSGLLLANAGNIGEEAAALDNNNNGVLTAYEASNLKLDDTNLVVLSACETGVGDVKAGEGVYGLQRAFMTAGAKSLLMSLWKVDDAATQELMSAFYSNWLKTGNKQMAFKQAQLAIKNKYKHPYYWGGFILLEN